MQPATTLSVPGTCAVTRPVALTVATAAGFDAHVSVGTVATVAPVVSTPVAVICTVAPAVFKCVGGGDGGAMSILATGHSVKNAGRLFTGLILFTTAVTWDFPGRLAVTVVAGAEPGVVIG